ESNYVADHLANRGHFCPIGFYCIEFSDHIFSFWLLHDQLGVAETKWVPQKKEGFGLEREGQTNRA
ncbi:hypothetical protein LINPERPRIM_LOCUS12698, partial [Linum perenne]